MGGLTPDWQAVVGKELDWAMPLIRNGTIAGLFLGDEPCCMGVPVWALETVAAFCKQKTSGTGAFVYGERLFPNDEKGRGERGILTQHDVNVVLGKIPLIPSFLNVALSTQ